MTSGAIPASFTPLIEEPPATDYPMQVILQPLIPSEGESVVLETNSKAVLSSLISSYCAHKGINYNGKIAIYDERKRPLPLYSTISALGIENGRTLIIGIDDSSVSVFRQWPIIIAFAAMAIGLIGILTMSLVYGLKGGEYFTDYGVVMDAGSSKTNTIAYKWRSSKHRGTGHVSQESFCYASGGIAKMDPMHLEPVIDCAKNVTSVIAPESISKTPLFLAATAGMRLLNLTNPQRVKDILQQLNVRLPETNLDVKVIEIISGKDEGIYGWITSNFLLKTLEEPQKFDPWEPTTYGALDMGGASTQISYAIPNSPNNFQNVTTIRLYGQSYKVYSQSNLCFGRDEADNRYHALLYLEREDPKATTIPDPCAPEEYNKQVTLKELFEPICVQNNKINDTMKSQETLLTFEGKSDSAACRVMMPRLLDNNLCKSLEFKECFKKHANLQNNQKYLAFATYFYTTKFLGITNVTLGEFQNTVNEFCLKNLTEIKKLTNSSYMTEFCFNAQYILEVLRNGFGFDESTWKNLEFVGQIADKDVGWTLGYMINATNLIPEKTTPKLISIGVLVGSLIFFLIVTLETAFYLICTYKKEREGLRC